MVLTLTAPGIPMLFQGQEFIEDEYFQDTEGLDWEKEEKHKGIENLIRDIIKLRTGETEGSKGLRSQHIEISHNNHETKILAYTRFDGNDLTEPVLVVLNFSNKDYGIGLNENEPCELRVNASSKIYDKDFSELPVDSVEVVKESTDAKNWTGKINIPAYGGLIFTKS
ncbi:alpha amylase C-terminal domain-containing protein [Maribacter sp. 1_MG-2023]|uniref:alpha amylase C-terminal domain-containing protein n=1 Tax=Maribacter sp. 1_MG-2023 TaxID=3062677 RepID=UPI0026E20B82|nr:alpha amylase C-terminal domain-containing protein [Maribacter sp. 1_MG-2023]MDO6473490.1 alpha amylase C-terminal domain-containing protein [Maribacter sp. 1_MG-2023]